MIKPGYTVNAKGQWYEWAVNCSLYLKPFALNIGTSSALLTELLAIKLEILFEMIKKQKKTFHKSIALEEFLCVKIFQQKKFIAHFGENNETFWFKVSAFLNLFW